MKDLKFIVAFAVTMLGYNVSRCQTYAGFDDLQLDSNSYWIGSNYGNNDFSSEYAHFSHFFDTTYSTWNGFAYTNIVDSTTVGWLNQYASRAGVGAENTENYGIFYQYGDDSIWFDSDQYILGMYVTNSTQTALSMQNGDDFAKKFGGESGNEPDWFLLTVNGYDETGYETGTIEFYLADYRFNNNSDDYIVTDWKWLDLSELGNVKTIKFKLTSSDNGDWGMNTPAYFCLDEIKSDVAFSAPKISNDEDKLQVYPNPFQNTINVKSNLSGTLQITNLNGQVIINKACEEDLMKIKLTDLKRGVYLLTLVNETEVMTKRIIKL